MGFLVRKKSSTFKQVAVCAVLTTATTHPLTVRAAPTIPFSDQTSGGVGMVELDPLAVPLSHTSLDGAMLSSGAPISNEFLKAQNDIAVFSGGNGLEMDNTARSRDSDQGHLLNVSGDGTSTSPQDLTTTNENSQAQNVNVESEHENEAGYLGSEHVLQISAQPHESGSPSDPSAKLLTQQQPTTTTTTSSNNEETNEIQRDAGTGGSTDSESTQGGEQVFPRTRRSSFRPRIVAGMGSVAGAAMVVVGALVGWRTASMRMRERRAAACASPSMRL